MNDTALFRGMDRTALDAAYNNSAAVKDSPQWLDKWRARSAKAREAQGALFDIPYAREERTKFDYFPSGKKNAPLLVFIHGGYWVRNSRDMFSFLATGPNAHGIDYVSAGYTLAPQASITQIAGEIQSCLNFLSGHGEELGYDDRQIFVSGWSAGGHLAALMAAHPAVRGTLPISGIFDLEPLSLNYINESLHFTPDEVKTLSPYRTLRQGLAPQRLVAGGNELPELQRQTRDFAQAARALGLKATDAILPGHHHFSIMDELAEPGGLITRELLTLIAETPANKN
ncbi:MAG: alpha/beta hydrolase [Bradyrhizobiaceae bacterium]|nr:MAG: alpha/beta hydrolase [Bradyrhizobiaceae bacterium]